MNDTDGKKPLGLGGSAPRSGQVKQSFSHGRTKSVLVETKRKRVVVPGKPAALGTAAPTSAPHLGDPAKRPGGISDAEMERRVSAWRAAKSREVEDNAKRAVAELAKAGVVATIRPETSHGKPLWSVLASGDAAVLTKIKKAGFADAYVLKH